MIFFLAAELKEWKLTIYGTDKHPQSQNISRPVYSKQSIKCPEGSCLGLYSCTFHFTAQSRVHIQHITQFYLLQYYRSFTCKSHDDNILYHSIVACTYPGAWGLITVYLQLLCIFCVVCVYIYMNFKVNKYHYTFMNITCNGNTMKIMIFIEDLNFHVISSIFLQEQRLYFIDHWTLWSNTNHKNNETWCPMRHETTVGNGNGDSFRVTW